jgi:hypothetical protein
MSISVLSPIIVATVMDIPLCLRFRVVHLARAPAPRREHRRAIRTRAE